MIRHQLVVSVSPNETIILPQWSSATIDRGGDSLRAPLKLVVTYHRAMTGSNPHQSAEAFRILLCHGSTILQV